jgi:diguanylate cyclase (GGDEF)-like protein
MTVPPPARLSDAARPVDESAGASQSIPPSARISDLARPLEENQGGQMTAPPPARISDLARPLEAAGVHLGTLPPARISDIARPDEETPGIKSTVPPPTRNGDVARALEAAGVHLGRHLPAQNSEMARAMDGLAHRQQQADDARGELTRLHRAVVEAEERVVRAHAAKLLAANERLVVATMVAQNNAEKSAKELKEVSISSGLDALTELPNRAVLLDRFGQAITHAKRNDTLLALLFLDLNNFKQINDTLGHAVGDLALKMAAKCLVSAIRAGDTVSRHGGDEFLILLAGVARASDAVLVAEKVIVALGTPFEIGDHSLRLTASIGISVYPDDADDVGTLIDLADAAMYLAKKHESGKYVFHGLRTGRTSRPPAIRRRGSGGP